MNDLDEILARLARAPMPAGLSAINHQVFEGVARHMAMRVRTRASVMSISGALLIGIVSAAVPPSEAAAASSIAPLAMVSPLSPASILGNL